MIRDIREYRRFLTLKSRVDAPEIMKIFVKAQIERTALNKSHQIPSNPIKSQSYEVQPLL
jgi:hypothetical protein